MKIVIQLRARPTRARGTGGPKVILLVHALNARLGHAHDVAPNRKRLVILAKHAHPNPLGVQPKLPSRQLPRPLARVLLKIIPETEIPQHFKKRMMPRRDADVFNVVRPHALLRRRRPLVRALPLSHEHRFKLQHPRNREQHRGIFRDQRTRRQHRVSARLVKFQKPLSNRRARVILPSRVRVRVRQPFALCRRAHDAHGDPASVGALRARAMERRRRDGARRRRERGSTERHEREGSPDAARCDRAEGRRGGGRHRAGAGNARDRHRGVSEQAETRHGVRTRAMTCALYAKVLGRGTTLVAIGRREIDCNTAS